MREMRVNVGSNNKYNGTSVQIVNILVHENYNGQKYFLSILLNLTY